MKCRRPAQRLLAGNALIRCGAFNGFGSFAKFKSQLAAVAGAVEAAGWGLLGYHPSTRKLMILQVENHQKQTAWGVVPLLMVDVFEHAYYLKYQNRRPEYVNNLFNIVNWNNVAERYVSARSYSG